jgi:hypothetical protein
MVLPSDPDQISTAPNQNTLGLIDAFWDNIEASDGVFTAAHKHDRHAAAILSGVSGLDLNTFILKTEMNDTAQSVSEDDVKELKKILWGVMIPYTTWNLKRVFAFPEDTPPPKSNDKDGPGNETTISETETWKRSDRVNKVNEERFSTGTENGKKDLFKFTQQNYILHLTVKIAQSLNLIFELNQKRSFSALAIAAYAEAMVDVLTHPHLRDRVRDKEVESLTHYLRRHPRYSNIFNIFTGHKLLRQFSMRASAPAANRKSNDVWMQLNISAANMHNLLTKNPTVYKDFQKAQNDQSEYTIPWHRAYYNHIASILRERLANLDKEIFDLKERDAEEADFVEIDTTVQPRTERRNASTGKKREWYEQEAGVFLPQLSMQERSQLSTKTRRIVDALSRPADVEQPVAEVGDKNTSSFSLLKIFST